MFRATLCSSSGADDLVVFFTCGVVPWLCRLSGPVGWLCVHWGVRSTLFYVHSHGTSPHVKNTTKLSAPEDGHKLARNMLSKL